MQSSEQVGQTFHWVRPVRQTETLEVWDGQSSTGQPAMMVLVTPHAMNNQAARALFVDAVRWAQRPDVTDVTVLAEDAIGVQPWMALAAGPGSHAFAERLLGLAAAVPQAGPAGSPVAPVAPGTPVPPIAPAVPTGSPVAPVPPMAPAAPVGPTGSPVAPPGSPVAPAAPPGSPAAPPAMPWSADAAPGSPVAPPASPVAGQWPPAIPTQPTAPQSTPPLSAAPQPAPSQPVPAQPVSAQPAPPQPAPAQPVSAQPVSAQPVSPWGQVPDPAPAPPAEPPPLPWGQPSAPPVVPGPEHWPGQPAEQTARAPQPWDGQGQPARSPEIPPLPTAAELAERRRRRARTRMRLAVASGVVLLLAASVAAAAFVLPGRAKNTGGGPTPPTSGSPSASPSASPIPRPTFQEGATPVAVLGGTWQPGEATRVQDFEEWPFAFRTPAEATCQFYAGEPAYKAHNCSWGVHPNHSIMAFVVRRCVNGCDATERAQFETMTPWKPDGVLAVVDPATKFVAVDYGDGREQFTMVHFFGKTPGGPLEWVVIVQGNTSKPFHDPVLKTLNDVRSQTP